jgi:hypothetical protein
VWWDATSLRALKIRSPLRLPHKIQRTSLDLIKDSGDVLPNDTERDQIDTGKKQKNPIKRTGIELLNSIKEKTK